MKNTMMKYKLIVLFLFSFSFVFSQDDNSIVIGEYAIIHSDVLNQDQYVMVHVPEGVDSTNRAPVLYVLDGAIHFYSVVGLVNSYGGTAMPKMIVVGVINNNRYQDFAPENYENYSKYIEDDLIPYVETNYPASSYKTLIGHSIAGLFTMNTFVNKTSLFNAYLPIDPSISFGNSEDLLTQFLNTLEKNELANVSIYTAVANTLPDGLKYSDIESDTSQSTLHIRSIIKMNNGLSKLDHVYYSSEYFEDESHNSLPYVAIYKGLKSIFDFYEIPESVWDTNSSSSKILSEHFQVVSSRMGYEIKPPEMFVNSLAYYKVKSDKPEAKNLFELNILNYPESANVYDSMGDYFVAIEDKANAVIFFEKANEISPSPERSEKIKLLK